MGTLKILATSEPGIPAAYHYAAAASGVQTIGEAFPRLMDDWYNGGMALLWRGSRRLIILYDF